MLDPVVNVQAGNLVSHAICLCLIDTSSMEPISPDACDTKHAAPAPAGPSAGTE